MEQAFEDCLGSDIGFSTLPVCWTSCPRFVQRNPLVLVMMAMESKTLQLVGVNFLVSNSDASTPQAGCT